MSKGMEVVTVWLGSAASSVYPEPSRLILRSLNVTSPPTAACESVPARVAPAVPVPALIVIATLVLLSLVARLPNASMISISMGGVIATPARASDGCTTNTSPDGGPGRDDAATVVSTVPNPRTFAARVCAPTEDPRVQKTTICPLASVSLESGVTVPPSAVAKRTGTPETPTSSLPRTSNTIESASVVLSTAFCEPPDTTTTALGNGCTLINALSICPIGRVATMVAVPRPTPTT